LAKSRFTLRYLDISRFTLICMDWLPFIVRNFLVCYICGRPYCDICMCNFIVGFCCLVIWQFPLVQRDPWKIIILYVNAWKSNLLLKAWRRNTSTSGVFISCGIVALMALGQFSRKKAIHVSRLDPFQTHYSMWPKVLPHVKKNSLYNQPKPYFFKTLLWSHFWIDFNKFYTKTFRIHLSLTF
jgi:hypothetical protein